MELRVVSWNVDGWHTIRDEQLQLLDDTRADVSLLQEVTPASLDLLRRAGWSGTSALELVRDSHVERSGARARFACAVLARGNVTVVSSKLVTGAPSSVRALMSRLRVKALDLTAISAALPPGSMWGRSAKVGQADAIDRAVQDVGSPVAIGMDRNGPKFERWDPETTEWWGEDPAHFADGRADQGCVDALDRWYAANANARRQAMHERPDGPREVSYIEQRADPAIQRRYDVIMADDAFEVRDVRYRYHEAISAGSDHGLVEATISL